MGGRPRAPLAKGVRAARMAYQAGPLEDSVARLGRKWTLLILRDLAFLHATRFNEILRNNPRLTPRVLSRRLREMQVEGLIVRDTHGGGVAYSLTPRGEDAVYVLLALLRYGLRRGDDPEPLREGGRESPGTAWPGTEHPRDGARADRPWGGKGPALSPSDRGSRPPYRATRA